jgi:hypothetical protein
MVSLADLFNPSFFIILGIVALLIALMVVYFESKMREQNHKIASMLSLVSTLAEDMNGVKMGLNHLAITTMGQPQNIPFQSQNLGNQPVQQSQLNLIEVSDDESEDEDDEEEVGESELEEIEDDETTSESEYEDDDEDEDNGENIKVIKLNISENVEEDANSIEEAIDFDQDDDLAVLEDIDDIPEISEGYAEELLSLKYEEKETPLVVDNIQLEETVVASASDLKTISINLGDESHSEHIEYKKLQLPKLRSIAVEKGLMSSSEAQKLKKPELLKLLGAE